MRARRWQAIACVAFAACAKPEARRDSSSGPRPPTTAAAQAAGPSDDSALNRAVADPSEGGDARPATDRADAIEPFMARPVWGKSIGHTSVVFKLGLEGGAVAAFKPRSRRGKTRYRGEIAAYRLARALGLSNVPAAFPRSFAMDELRRIFGDPSSGAGKLLADEALANEHGDVHGALIPWIAKLRFLDLETEPSRSEWRSWLTQPAPVPLAKAHLAAQISTMIVFDYLTANWDRWSGGQIGTDAEGETVLYLDNDGAFFDPPPPEPLAKQRALLSVDARFSKRFVAALRALDPDAAKAAMGMDGPGDPLLAPRVLAGLEERRRIALAIVDARIAKDGEDKVLYFE